MDNKIPYAFPKLKDMDPSCYIDAYNLVLECSHAHSPRSFIMKLLDMMNKVCPYDQAIVLFLDVNGKVSGRYTVNLDEKWIDLYLQYYMNIVEYPQEISLFQDVKEESNFNFSRIYEWASFPKSEFITDYINELDIKHSWGFCFFDLNGAYRVVISLDRTRNVPFSETEQQRLALALPILNNMHKNFFYQGMDTSESVVQSPWKAYNLTKRETEIANLLCQGMTVQNISNVLYIAITTTYKHIAHIYEKVGVSSQQELLVKMLNKKVL